ncbi:hypothetical protein SPRG_06777 [Saprolegnia parasitica CBS 223.65]|uniref:CAP-Gly domain-containing protein n=1 Tax=Saprolegnia parasitica (strain CBS 223.65) TaxID=695850 RepID=A0A067CEA3_SAPPC|nr:hypothetical protein SPRG_06777 [Saprolegnia parasitica CBS 223.65]KDO27510.1 hypothetical protein SPRG_06777 [Saprolegnia parasitica CBS 223.65]|eukprot:XP_012201637.1 hypothetical protein SPRG_06777 [Saprolegnia parasitica CBS 223.65]
MAALGDRVQDAEGFRGTLRYAGTIHSKGSDAIYYGIEWDDASRGKHDGEAGGVRYFTTAAPTSGSFVVPEKVMRGVGFLDALHERYMQAEASDVRVAGEVATSSGSSKSIQLVGVHKIQERQDLGVICKVSLESCRIARMPEPDVLRSMAPNIEVLNLGFNLLGSWREVLTLAHALPKLEHLVLSGNRLAYDVPSTSSVAFPSVTSLVLNQTNLKWTDVQRVCSAHFPQLRELYVASNELADADLLAAATLPWPAHLELVDLSHNQLSDWSVLEQSLGALPSLKHVLLNGNALPAILPTPPGSFSSLVSISISDNLIDAWSSMDALNALPSLELLRFAKNPLIAALGAGEARMIIVARCARLVAFNGSEIRAKERIDAEQMYLKRILHELASFPSDDDKLKVASSHPRFDELVAKYPDIQVRVRAVCIPQSDRDGPAALARSLVAVTFLPMSINATTMDPMEKKLPLNMKVGQLKLLQQKGMPIPLDDDACDVGYYGLQDGAEILVNDVW